MESLIALSGCLEDKIQTFKEKIQILSAKRQSLEVYGENAFGEKGCLASTPGTHCYCPIDVGRTSSSDENCWNYLPSEEDFDLYMTDCGNFCFSNIRVAWRPRFKALMKEPRF